MQKYIAWCNNKDDCHSEEMRLPVYMNIILYDRPLKNTNFLPLWSKMMDHSVYKISIKYYVVFKYEVWWKNCTTCFQSYASLLELLL